MMFLRDMSVRVVIARIPWKYKGLDYMLISEKGDSRNMDLPISCDIEEGDKDSATAYTSRPGNLFVRTTDLRDLLPVYADIDPEIMIRSFDPEFARLLYNLRSEEIHPMTWRLSKHSCLYLCY